MSRNNQNFINNEQSEFNYNKNEFDQNDKNFKIMKSIFKIEIFYFAFLFLLVIGLISTFVNYAQQSYPKVLIETPIWIDIVSLIFLEISEIILIIKQWKLKNTSKDEKRILILYFYGLFLIFPTIIGINLSNKKFLTKNRERKKVDIIGNYNMNAYGTWSFCYLVLFFQFFFTLLLTVLNTYNLLAYFIMHSLYELFWLDIIIPFFYLIILEIVNIGLLSRSMKLGKEYPNKFKNLWILHLLGMILIIPSIIVIFIILSKWQKIISQEKNENTNNLDPNIQINKNQIKLNAWYFKSHKLTQEEKLIFDFIKMSGLYIGMFYAVLIFLIITLLCRFCLDSSGFPIYAIPLVIMILMWICLELPGFSLSVLQAKLELAFPNKIKKIRIIYLIGLLLIIPTIVSIYITKKSCTKIINEQQNEMLNI